MAGKSRKEIHDLYRKGEVAKALAAQRSLIEALGESASVDDVKFLGVLQFASGHYGPAAETMKQGQARWPHDPDFAKNVGVCLSRIGKDREALTWLEQAVAEHPKDANLHDALARLYGRARQEDQARHHGETSLRLKDQAAAAVTPVHDLQGVPVPPFDPDRPERNLISFSLWGSAARYLDGAISNARLAPHLYPEWRCRFHVDETVPPRVLAELIDHGAGVVVMPNQRRLYEGLFWRFLVANDASVERYLVRDADSVIGLRERLAVEEWIESGRHFHVMRDWWSHSDPVLAGLWGGVAGALPPLPPLFDAYLEDPVKNANCDQKFLKEVVWPFARTSVLAHDRYYRVLDAKQFPSLVKPQGRQHIGDNADFRGLPELGKLQSRAAGRSFSARKRFIFTITTGRSGTAFLAALLRENLADAEVHHERTGFGRFGVTAPDASTCALFNSEGNVSEVRHFWRRKLGLARQGEAGSYVETSHVLAKAGLIENLEALGPAAEIHLVLLRRDSFATAWSLANRFDFANRRFDWLFGLDPSYPRNIVSPKPLAPHGVLGSCLWYVAEILTRGEYYRRLLTGRRNIRIHQVTLEDLGTEQGAAALISALNDGVASTSVVMPQEMNGTRQWSLGQKKSEALRKLVAAYPFDPAKLAAQFFDAGRRLG